VHTRIVRLAVLAALGTLAAGCVELGVVGDGTSVSVGKPSGGRVIDGVRLPNQGEGFFTRPVWASRGQRYGTDELIDLLAGVSRRMIARVKDTRLVIADLSGRGGGPARLWHRSHQSGRDVDLLYYVRKDGQAVEPDAMRAFDRNGVARDGSGITLDVARTWMLVKDLVTAYEAPVQYIFIYEPIAVKLIEHAQLIGEPEPVIAKVRRALKQPGDSAPHHDHMHVRIYCSEDDKLYGCRDMGPMDLWYERQAELEASEGGLAPVIAAAFGSSTTAVTAAAAPLATAITTAPQKTDLRSFGRLLRTRSPKLLRWR
jgi:penicillin-insensitive murein DD-endopeptidase